MSAGADIQKLPEAAEMERGVLSCLMQAPDLAGACLELLTEDDFSAPAHAVLWRLIAESIGAGRPVDPVSLLQLAMDRNLLEKCGGPGNIAEIATFAPVPAHARHYAQQVRDRAAQRRSVLAAIDFTHRVTAEPEGWREATGTLIDALVREQTGTAERATIVPVRDAILQALDEIEEAHANRGHVTHGLMTGFTDLDRSFMGLRPGQNLVIAGRPSMGKTALACNILENIATGSGHYREFYDDPGNWPNCTQPRQEPRAVVLVCLESSQIEMASRLVCGRAQVSLQRIRDGLMGRSDIERITAAANVLGQSRMHIWDAAGISVEELEVELKAFRRKVPDLAAVAVDHCGLLRAHGIKDAGNDYARVGYISNRLRLLWKTLNVVGMPLWQLSREVEKRGDKRPKQSDLRDSGKIEEDASHIIMPYRPGYYDRDADPEEAFIIISKNRGGPVNAEGIPVRWEAEFTRFSSTHDRLFSNDPAHRQQKHRE